MARESNSFGLLLRYQAQAERHYRRAIEEFDRLKALREELPIEPITEPDLEPRKTTYPDPPTNPNGPGKTSLQACQAGEPPQPNMGRDVSGSCGSFRRPGSANRSQMGRLHRIQLSSQPSRPFHGLQHKVRPAFSVTCPSDPQNPPDPPASLKLRKAARSPRSASFRRRSRRPAGRTCGGQDHTPSLRATGRAGGPRSQEREKAGLRA
jgi:hypothetical protein